MPNENESAPAYSPATRAAAVLGLLALGLFAFMFLDVALGGRLTTRECEGCGDDNS